MSVGMSALLLASLGHWFLRPAGQLAVDVTDAIYGLLMGIAIMANLMSVRLARGCRRET
jgi:TctA family transporter